MRPADDLLTPLSGATLERFREAAGGIRPTPAGVAVAAVSASFAFGLLAKALAVSSRRNAPSGHRPRLESLVAAARTESSRMLEVADADMAAFEAYLAAGRLPATTDGERCKRQEARESALRRTIDVPLAAARSAASGLQLCTDAAALTDKVVLADLATAAALLSGALRAFALCAESNVSQLARGISSYREQLAAESGRHRQASRQAAEVLERVASALGATTPTGEP